MNCGERYEAMIDHGTATYVQVLINCEIIPNPQKIQAWTGFRFITSAIPVQCSNNWAIKPTGSWPLCGLVYLYVEGEEYTELNWNFIHLNFGEWYEILWPLRGELWLLNYHIERNLLSTAKRSVTIILVLLVGRFRFVEENEGGTDLRFPMNKIWRFAEYEAPYNRSYQSQLFSFIDCSTCFGNR